ncbi:DUF262 domain-containing protein [Pseudomonas cichorii]|uniref:DUF262 domain-containing protein n=1 Tax=Pseudomonas cichorii TaxID=36746 RepID=UPI001C8AD849|nr:DUF262 domain-containing protein [Pseudomonas cichorii]MBX8531074.1 DUF262 domain-containing protein [Pseudomonas cichorii]MBX8538621.1 DUF262 domain-containing protein [Pseudomonas cichorii]MBX8578517.1 DUF262 domain-containing protein [Pseudomonas cichorii]
MSSTPQTYTVSDFIEWNAKKQLNLSPDFQRGSVWTPSAKVFLIDTILNDLPMPQVFFRTKIDAATQTMTREVVDGQQRLRTILEFAAGKLKLSSKSPRFKGKVYVDLDVADQESFLSYKIPCVQLINSDNSMVLEIFARLNSYSVKVTPAELRHAEYIEPIKWAIYDASRDWKYLWNELGVVSVRDSVRMKNVSLMAEFFMTFDMGFGDGGEPTITKFYKNKKNESEEYFIPIRKKVDAVLDEIIDNFEGDFSETTFFDAPNFLVLFAVVAYLKYGLPDTRITEGVEEHKAVGINWDSAVETLAEISLEFEAEHNDESADGRHAEFIGASRSTTHRISSRKPRFQLLVKAFSNDAA